LSTADGPLIPCQRPGMQVLFADMPAAFFSDTINCR
jgi:hypothetical protein